jgi:hypothetical protein
MCGQSGLPPDILSVSVVAEEFLWPKQQSGGTDYESKIIALIRNCFRLIFLSECTGK